MGWFGDLLPIIGGVAGTVFGGPLGGMIGSGIGGGVNSVTGGSGGGNSGMDLSWLAPLLAGQATSQRIPGQTTPGSYTPQQGGFGTYNYIPTGAEQIDPALLWQIMNLGAMNNQAQGTGYNANNQLLQSGMSNPNAANMQNWAGIAGRQAGDTGAMASGMQNYMNLAGLDQFTYGKQNLGNYQGLLDQARANPLAGSYIGGAQAIGADMGAAGRNIQNTSASMLDAGNLMAGQALSNPYSGQLMEGANTAGAMLGNTGMSQAQMGTQFAGRAANEAMPAASQILNTAFDPQNALYNQTLGKTMDQIGTLMARTGTTDSGTGLKYGGDVLRDFNIDWQNNQLGRQTQGMNAYTSGMTGAGQNMGTGTNLQTTGAQNVAGGAAMPYEAYRGLNTGNLDVISQLADLARTTAGTAGAAGNLQMQGNAAGYDAYGQNLNNQLQYVQGVGNATSAMGNTYNNVTQGTAANANLGSAATGAYQAAGQLPYGAYQQNYGDQMQSLMNYFTNASGINNLSTAPIGAMQNYMGGVMTGAGNAANAASGAQSGTINQNAQSAAGLTPIIGQGLDWLGNMFGGSGGSSNPWSWAGSSFTGGNNAYPNFATGASPYPSWAM